MGVHVQAESSVRVHLLLLSVVAAGARWGKGEPCLGRGGRAQLLALLEQPAELLPDLAAARLALLPLVGIDAQGGVGLSVSQPTLHVDQRDVR